jgi:hypothetical protein
MNKSRRPSPALVVACLALVAALAGTAVAGGVLTSKKAKKIANAQITKRAPGLTVKNAATAGNVYFAKVSYTTSTPVVTSSSGGITGNGETITGTPSLVFPRDMTNCAITATPKNSGGTASEIGMRQSNTSTGATVYLAMWRTDNNASTRSDFNVQAVCP